ncbi:hypothetical protein M2153_000439 [Pseudomonas sp. JUb96]|nr:hypothetical protein [Pseudomonas sp. JUb96]
MSMHSEVVKEQRSEQLIDRRVAVLIVKGRQVE